MIRATPYVIALTLSLVALPASADCDRIDAYVEVGTSSSEYYSAAIARCYLNDNYGYAFISISHTIKGGEFGTGPTLYFNDWQTQNYEAQDSTHWFGSPADCFYTEGDFFISHPDLYPVYHDATGTACACIPGSPNPPSGEDEQDACSGDPSCNPPGSPLIIALHDRYQLTSPAAGVLFDIDADGEVERVAWTEAGTNQAFVALDRNGNRRIDSGAELFGDYTTLPSGERAPNGFVALAALDSNGNGVIDIADNRWPELLLWIDENHNGQSEAHELQGIAAAGIEELGLRHILTRRRDRHGNLFKYKGIYRRHGVLRPYYDIWLVIQP